MKLYRHDKTDLAKLIARNDSKRTKEPVWVFISGIKSVPTMKYCDTTVVTVCPHSQLLNPAKHEMAIAVFHKGRERKIY